MKRLIAVALGLALAIIGAFALAPRSVSANVAGFTQLPSLFPGTGADTRAIRTATKGTIVYDSGLVAAGALIDTGVLDVSGYTTLSVLFDNLASGTSRTPQFLMYLADRATTYDSVSCAGISSAVSRFEAGHGGGTAAPITCGWPLTFSPYVQFKLTAGGAANGRIVVVGR